MGEPCVCTAFGDDVEEARFPTGPSARWCPRSMSSCISSSWSSWRLACRGHGARYGITLVGELLGSLRRIWVAFVCVARNATMCILAACAWGRLSCELRICRGRRIRGYAITAVAALCCISAEVRISVYVDAAEVYGLGLASSRKVQHRCVQGTAERVCIRG